jgi:hypothetical protein
MAIKIRRGLDADRLTVLLEEGEVAYTTDTKKFYIGDGSTLGGNRIGSDPATWGFITGTLSAQTDLQTALNNKIPSTRSLTINGTTQDLSADRTFTIATGLTVGTTPITSGTVGRVLFEGTGNVLQESANLFWDDTNNRLGIGTASPSAIIHSVGSVTASSAIARGNYLQPTLVAAANNDVLVGLDIAPTFTTGAFTGVQSVALRLPSTGRITNATTGGGYNVYITNSEATLNSPSTSGIVGFQLGYTFVGRFMATTGNFILQNGGTFTDAGYKLDVNGTARVQGNLTLLGTTAIGGGYGVTSGTFNIIQNGPNIVPTSGTMVVNGFAYTGTINQTGTATGITRGLYINPTLTAVADFRAIEVASGITILGAATTAKASLRIPSGTAPTSPVNGDIWFDGTYIKMRIGGVTKTFTLI